MLFFVDFHLQGAEDDIAAAVANIGPVSIAFHSPISLKAYKKGIYEGYDLIPLSSISFSSSGSFALKIKAKSIMLVN